VGSARYFAITIWMSKADAWQSGAPNSWKRQLRKSARQSAMFI
jgi:hypothetical protein